MAPQFTITRGSARRLDKLWIAFAISSLPVPLSPSIRIVLSLRATSGNMLNISCIL